MHSTELTRAIWLLLLGKGGWWTVPEVVHERPSWAKTTAERQQVAHALRGLAKHGACVRRLPVGTLQYQYAITPTCCVVKGITLREVLGAANGKAPEFAG